LFFQVQTETQSIIAAPVEKPFSEGDVTPTSRPSSPSVVDGAASADWKWGELPRTPAATPTVETTQASMKVVDETVQTTAPASGGWMASVLQPFMRKPGAGKNGEVYLDDVTKDPKLAAIYFPKV